MTVRSDLAGISVQTGLATGTTSSSATTNGTGIDLGSANARLMLIGFVGTRTDGTYTFKLQDSADNSTFADVAVLSGALTAISASDTRRTACYGPTRRYVRAVLTSATVTTGATGTGALILVVDPALV